MLRERHHALIIRGSFTPLNLLRILRVVSRREMPATVTTTRAARCRMSAWTAWLSAHVKQSAL
jgi:hypothetical protein